MVTLTATYNGIVIKTMTATNLRIARMLPREWFGAGKWDKPAMLIWRSSTDGTIVTITRN